MCTKCQGVVRLLDLMRPTKLHPIASDVTFFLFLIFLSSYQRLHPSMPGCGDKVTVAKPVLCHHLSAGSEGMYFPHRLFLLFWGTYRELWAEWLDLWSLWVLCLSNNSCAAFKGLSWWNAHLHSRASYSEVPNCDWPWPLTFLWREQLKQKP